MMKKNQREILELRNAITERKLSREGISVGLDRAEGKVCRFKDEPFEMTDSEE